MRIGLFTDDFLPRKSGVVTSTLALKHGLEKLGHNVYVIAPSVRGYQETEENVIRITSLNPLVFDKSRLALPHPGTIKKIDNLKLDIVHSQTQFMVGLLADAVAKRRNIPHITTAHTVWTELLKHYPFQVTSAFGLFSLTYQIYFQERIKVFESISAEDFEKPLSQQIKKQMWFAQNVFFNNCDAVIVPSNHLLEDLKLHNMKQQSFMIPNGVEQDIFIKATKNRSFTKKPLRILCVGRLSLEKRQDALLRAIALLPPDSVQLTFVGEGPHQNQYQALAKELGISKQISFTGTLESGQIVDEMKKSDILALVSYKFDNQPMVILEALTAGLPVLYCDPVLTVGLSKENSICSLNENPEALAAALEQFQAMPPAARKRMSTAARKSAEDFTAEAFATKVLAVYRQLLHQ